MTPQPLQAAETIDRATGWTSEVARLRPDAAALAWLTEPGLLTARARRHCHGVPGLRIVEERHGLLTAADARTLGVTGPSAFFREIELTCDGRAMVFAQTLIPEATLAAEPWLATLGTDALGPRLASLGGAVREPLEFAWLSPGHPLLVRALRHAAHGVAGLWARRARYRLAAHCLVVQEVFLPAVLQ